jgi:hypothetical protein
MGKTFLARSDSVAWADIEKGLPVTEIIQEWFEFPTCERRVVEANFQAGDIISDGAVCLFAPSRSSVGF